MISVTGRLLPALLACALVSMLPGCGSGCGFGEDSRVSWTRELTVASANTVFPDSAAGSDTVSQPYIFTLHDVYLTRPRESGEQVRGSTPRVIHLVFKTMYSGPRLQSWRAGGLFVNPSSDTSVYEIGILQHEVLLDTAGLPAGTYPFSLADTSGRMRVRVEYMSLSALSLSRPPDTVALADFSGAITITQGFTQASGAFTFEVRAEYLPGQHSVFAGSGSYEGARRHKTCVTTGIIVD